MMEIDWILEGLPRHALTVHFTVVMIPAAALAVLLSAFWPAAQRRLGLVTPGRALIALNAMLQWVLFCWFNNGATARGLPLAVRRASSL